jgi:hypothetical protein
MSEFVYIKNGQGFVKLSSEQHPRLLGRFDKSDQKIFIIRRKSRHIFVKTWSYGFNDYLLRNFGIQTIRLIDEEKFVYTIPVGVILSEGHYLTFQEQGFERQIFLRIGRIQMFKDKQQPGMAKQMTMF